ncbi:unnamed protein product [Heligmosomoides polygyrus]|uniref:Uncharacterized protein n=1 Tax=Heligmosomoides polygyrus TaxID=6339 RepID=A0A183GEN3_HELPZ|nr:unnamed protein product [Heligmosomoides polygyrus]
MSNSARVVIHLLFLECGTPLDAPPSREEKKLADRTARILRPFEGKPLEEIHDEENLEIEEDEVDGGWNIIDEDEDLNMDQPAGSKTITCGQEVPEKRVCF